MTRKKYFLYHKSHNLSAIHKNGKKDAIKYKFLYYDAYEIQFHALDCLYCVFLSRFLFLLRWHLWCNKKTSMRGSFNQFFWEESATKFSDLIETHQIQMST